MTSPIWLDGPLEGRDHEVDAAAVEQGIYVYDPAQPPYTFTRVTLFGRVVVVASAGNGVPSPDLLFRQLTSAAAQRAVEE